MKSVFSAAALTLCFAIFSRAQKQRSWLGPNNFLTLQNNRSKLVSPFNSLVVESKGKAYGFGGLPGAGGDEPMILNRFNFFY